MKPNSYRRADVKPGTKQKFQTVFRTDGSNRSFTQVSNVVAQHPSMRRDVKGLLLELLSRPKDWDISIEGLVATGVEGRDCVYRQVKDAVALGFMRKHELRRADGTTIKVIYWVSDSPERLAEMRLPDFPEVDDQRLPGFPETAKPETANPTQQRKESTKDRKEETKDAVAVDVQPADMAFDLIQSALAVHGRDYNRSRQREKALMALIASDGMPYIERIAEHIRRATALKLLTRLQSHKLIEDEEIRTRLLDGEYVEKSAGKPGASAGQQRAAKPTVYSAEFEDFWERSPSSARLKGKKREAFQNWQQMAVADRADALIVAKTIHWDFSLPEPQYCQSVFKWLEGECWIPLAEENEIALHYFARRQRERELEQAQHASPPQRPVLVVVDNEMVPF